MCVCVWRGERDREGERERDVGKWINQSQTTDSVIFCLYFKKGFIRFWFWWSFPWKKDETLLLNPLSLFRFIHFFHIISDLPKAIISSYIYIYIYIYNYITHIWLFWLFGFYGISTFVGHSTPNSVYIYIHIQPKISKRILRYYLPTPPLRHKVNFLRGV